MNAVDVKVKCLTGENPNVWKYVFSDDTAVAECVLYRYPDFKTRTVICCSTMSGCPIGCRFCGSGDYFVRNLEHEEISMQVMHVLGDHGLLGRSVFGSYECDIDKLQIMLMSMGEPLLNWSNVGESIEYLHTKLPEAQLLISTVAPRCPTAWKGLFEISKEIDKVGLQFSIHNPFEWDRDKLIPFKNKLTLEEIATIGEDWHSVTGRNPFFNYCAHENNTSDVYANGLKDLFDPTIWNCTISVVCERGENVAKANERQRQLANDFMDKMLARGYNVRKFDPAGQDDIGGGCGQLFHVQKWMKEHPDLVIPSRGHGKPVLHMPT